MSQSPVSGGRNKFLAHKVTQRTAAERPLTDFWGLADTHFQIRDGKSSGCTGWVVTIQDTPQGVTKSTCGTNIQVTKAFL